MRIALIHDWLDNLAGAEQVLHQMVQVFPLDLFTLVDFMVKEQRSWMSDCNVTTSFLQRLPFARTSFACICR